MAHVNGTNVAQVTCYGCNVIIEHREVSGNIVRNEVERIIREQNLIIRGEVLDKWDGGAFFLNFVLEESHITLTSYPLKKEGYSIKVYVELCNYRKDNYKLTLKLAELIVGVLEPVLSTTILMTREGPEKEDVARALRFSKRNDLTPALSKAPAKLRHLG